MVMSLLLATSAAAKRRVRIRQHCKMATGPTLTEKFQGCLVGGLLGDCLGAPFEAHIKNTVIPDQRTFFQNLLKGEVVFGPLAGRNFRPSEVDQEHGWYHYTDDSAMTFCLARSLLAKGGFDPLDVAKRPTEYLETIKWLVSDTLNHAERKLKLSSYADPYKPAMEQFEGRGSYGNGASMRVAPVALFYTKDHEKMIEVARNQAMLTHSNESAYNAAILQCMAIATALRSDPGTPFDSGHFMSHLVALMLQQEKSHNGQGPLFRKMELIKKIVCDPTQDPTPAEVAVMLGNDMSAQGSVPTAIYSFLRSQRPLTDFE
ncbi:hypothetical protein HPB47_015804, partial [Ixodes persulcatus]